MGSLPRQSVVVADQQSDRRRGAGRAVAYRAILGKQNIDVSMAIRRQRGLPLIPRVVADTMGGSEARNRQRHLRGRQRQKQAHGKLLHTAGAAGSENHRTSPGTTPATTFPALYPNPLPASITR